MTINLNWWTLAFSFSLIFNIGLVLYIRYLLRILVRSSERVKQFNDDIISFAAHVKGVNELEAFYGDETIAGLLRHSLEVVDIVEGFSEIMDVTEPSEEDLLEEQDDSEQDNEAQEEARPEVEKEVLYAGTRRRDN